MRRHHYLAVGAIISLCVLGILGLSLFKFVTAQDGIINLILPPTAPIGVAATYTGSGVTLDWQAAQGGTYPIKQYHIWRQAEGADFSEIATVDSDATTYSDADGVVNEHYKLTVEDDQDPANVSTDSEIVSATEPAPTVAKSDLPPKQVEAPQVTNLPQGLTLQDIVVPNVTVFNNQLNTGSPKPGDTNPANTTPGGANLNQAKPTNPAAADIKPIDVISSPQANAIIQAGEVHVAQLEGAISVSNTPVLQPILIRYSYEKQVIYQHYDQLPQDQQAKAKSGCQQDFPALETSILNLPESLQINAVIAMASCQLVLGHP